MTDVVISSPDTSLVSTQVVELQSYLYLNVTRQEDLFVAKAGLDAVAKQRPVIVKLFAKAKADARAALDSVTELENSFLDPLTKIDKHLRAQVLRYSEEQTAKAEELRKQLQAEADQKAAEECDPWDEPGSVEPVTPVVVPRAPKMERASCPPGPS